MYKIQLQTKYLKCIKRHNNLQRIFPKTIQQIVLINNTTLNTSNTAGIVLSNDPEKYATVLQTIDSKCRSKMNKEQ